MKSINANVAASLAALSRDYAALAAAARAENEAAYARAQRAIGSDGARATSALTALRQAGYTVPRLIGGRGLLRQILGRVVG